MDEEEGNQDLKNLVALAERWVGASASVGCNRHQCKALSMLLSNLVSYACHWKLFFGYCFTADTRDTLHALNGAVQEVVRLLDDYGKRWHAKALVSQENALGFEYLAENVERYVDMINSRLLRTVSSAEDRVHVQQLIDKATKDKVLLHRYLREVASLDRKDLREKADDVLLNSSSLFFKTIKSRCGKLARKLQSRGSSDTFDIDLKELEISSKQLGEGSAGTVFKGQWMELPVAVKVSPKDDIHFNIEAEIMRGLQPSHPNIVQILGAAEGKDKRFLVMELMDMNLERFLEQQRSLSLGDKVDIMLQIATGMLFLHLNGICYRDMKPRNLLVKIEPCLRVKLADFGHSKAGFCSLNPNTGRYGTYPYMSPEVMREERYSRKSDVFSFGIVCGEILTGRHEFERFRAKEILQQRVRGVRPVIDDVPHEKLKNLVERCWKLEQEQRPGFEEIHEVLWEIKTELLTGSSNTSSQHRSRSMVSVPSGFFSPLQEDLEYDNSTSSGSSPTTSPASVSDLRVTGPTSVGSTLLARWKVSNGTWGFRVQWGKYPRPESQQPEWHEPVTTTSTGSELVLTPDDYGARMCVKVIPLSNTDEVMWTSPEPVTLDGKSQLELEKYLAEGHASFEVTIQGQRWAKLVLSRQSFHVWWSMGNPKNFREAYWQGCVEASKENPTCCVVKSGSREKSYKLAFGDQQKRNIAVVAMIQFMNRYR